MRMTSKGIQLEGFNGFSGVEDVDQNNVIFGAMTNKQSRFNEIVKARRKNQELKKTKNEAIKKQKFEAQKIAKDRAHFVKAQKVAQRRRQHDQAQSAHFLKAAAQPVMGYDYSSLMGDPNSGNFSNAGSYTDSHNLIGEASNEAIDGVESFGNTTFNGGIKIGKIKLKAPKISAPKIKIAPLKIAAPKLPLKIAAPKVPTLKQVGGGISKGLKQTVKTVAHVAAAPIAAGAHVLKQAGGHKLESGLKAATGVSVTQMARGGDATVAQVGKAAGAVISAPVKLTDKAIKQIGGHKLVNALDRATGGTYTQAVNVGTLPGRALAGQAITKKDWVEVASLAVKVGAAVAAGGVIGYAADLGKQYASKELASKLGGSAGLIFAGLAAATSGDVIGTLQTKAQEEAQKKAMAEATKKLGPDAAGILAIGSAAYSGGAGAAADVAKDIGKEKALKEVAQKTGLPVGVLTAVQSGKVPSPSEMKDSMQKELLAAPDKLQAELKKIPELAKNAPEAAKKALAQKEALIKSELANRDKKVAELVKKHSDELKNADEKIKTALDKTNLQAVDYDKAKEELLKVQKDPKSTADQIAKAQENEKSKAEDLAKSDAETAVLVAEKENMDNVYQAKEYSASNGLYGVRTAENGAVLAEYKDKLPQSAVDNSLMEHPFLSAGLIPRPAKKG